MCKKPTYVESKPLQYVVRSNDAEVFAKRLGEVIRENAHCQGMTMNNLVDLTGLRLLTIVRIFNGKYGPQGRFSHIQSPRRYDISVFNAVKVTKALGLSLSDVVEEVRKTVHCKAGYVDGNPVLYLSEQRRQERLARTPKIITDAEVLGDKVRLVILEQLEKQGMTAADLAERAGICKAVVSGITAPPEVRSNVASVASYLAVAQSLGMSLSELFKTAEELKGKQ